MSSLKEIEVFQSQHLDKHDFEEEERELEEALSLSDLPITTIAAGNDEQEARLEDETGHEDENLDFNFDFGLLVGSIDELDNEMCAADEIFSCGQILPYRNSVSSLSELRSCSRSKSMDHLGLGSRSSSSSRSSSIKSRLSTTSGSSNHTSISVKTAPVVSKVKIQNKFHSYPNPKPQYLGSGARISTHTPPIGRKLKMWEVLKLGLVRTPEIELQDLKLRHHTNNFGKLLAFPRNNSSGSNSNSNSNNIDRDRARQSCSHGGNAISDFVLEMQKRKKNQQQLSGNKIRRNRNGGFFKSCTSSIGAISPMPTRPNYYYGGKSGYFGTNSNVKKYGNSQNNPAIRDKKLAQKEKHQQQKEKRKNNQIRQEKYVVSHHQHHTFEWLKTLSHASVLNS